MANQNQLLDKINLTGLDAIFDQFAQSYTSTTTHYKDGGHPAYLLEALGHGIVPSFHGATAPGAKVHGAPEANAKPASSGPSRVGLALSMFHITLRNLAKEWGRYFDQERVADPELREIMHWMETPGAKFPKALLEHAASDDMIRDEIIRRFALLPEVPIKDGDKVVSIPNGNIHVKQTLNNGHESGVIEFDVPVAAVVFGLKAASKSITGRPSTDPMSAFLKRVIGMANIAGQKIEALNSLHPDIFQFDDANKEITRRTLIDQKFWIKTIATAEHIKSNGTPNGYDAVLTLINEDAKTPCRSANKAAVLLYAITERLDNIRNWAQGNVGQGGSVPGEIARRLGATHEGMNLEETISTIRQLSAELTVAGKPTEDSLMEAKREQRTKPDLKVYDRRVLEIFEEQKSRVEQVFAGNPKYKSAMEAAYKFVDDVEKPAAIKPDVMNRIVDVVNFCLRHVPNTQKQFKVRQPDSPG